LLRGRFDEIVGKAGLLVGERIAVELRPAGVVMRDHVDHQIQWRQRLECVVAECASELPA
jgi:hypothetical protein